MKIKISVVICRIGSLEMRNDKPAVGVYVICRIGSLEIIEAIEATEPKVICRIGSLENEIKKHVLRPWGYLPYRQLRKGR